MISDNNILDILERVLNSSEFSQSETYKKLLTYLVDKSLSHHAPREFEIAIDVFGRDSSYNPNSDSLVRSHMYALRNKLEKYYLTEGDSDKIRLVIPKGRYEVHFEDTTHTRSRPVVRRSLVYFCIFIISVLIVAFLAFFLSDRNYHRRINALSEFSTRNEIWRDFQTSSHPTIIALGDYFIFWEKSMYTSGDRKVRDGAINSQKDLQQFLINNPEQRKNIGDNTGSYLAPDLVNGLVKVLPFFVINNLSVSYQPASILNQSTLQSNNIVFIGPYKTLGIFQPIIDQLRLRFQVYPHRILLDDVEMMNYMNIELPDETNFRKDYVLVAKVPGPNKTIILIIAFFAPGSIREKISSATNPEFIDVIRDSYLDKGEKFPTYFESLFEVNDFQGVINVKLTHFFSIEAENLIYQDNNP